MQNIGIFYGNMEYILAIWYIIWPFGNLVVFWYISPFLVYFVSRKIWQPCCKVPAGEKAVSQSREYMRPGFH
jgi:hypothetical protein